MCRKLTGLDGDCEKAVEELVGYFEGKIKDKGAALEEVYNRILILNRANSNSFTF